MYSVLSDMLSYHTLNRLQYCVNTIFFFLLAPRHVEHPGQGLNRHHSCHLDHSCGNAGSLIRCAGRELRYKLNFHMQ